MDTSDWTSQPRGERKRHDIPDNAMVSIELRGVTKKMTYLETRVNKGFKLMYVILTVVIVLLVLLYILEFIDKYT